MHQRGMSCSSLVQQLSTTFRILQGFSAFVKSCSVNRRQLILLQFCYKKPPRSRDDRGGLSRKGDMILPIQSFYAYLTIADFYPLSIKVQKKVEAPPLISKRWSLRGEKHGIYENIVSYDPIRILSTQKLDYDSTHSNTIVALSPAPTVIGVLSVATPNSTFFRSESEYPL